MTSQSCPRIAFQGLHRTASECFEPKERRPWCHCSSLEVDIDRAAACAQKARYALQVSGQLLLRVEMPVRQYKACMKISNQG